METDDGKDQDMDKLLDDEDIEDEIGSIFPELSRWNDADEPEPEQEGGENDEL